MSDFNTTIQLSNGHLVTVTPKLIRALRDEAAQAGDADMIHTCDVALGLAAPGGQGPDSQASAQMTCAEVFDDVAAQVEGGAL